MESTMNDVAHSQKGGPPAWGLDKGIIIPHRNNKAWYEMLHRAVVYTVMNPWAPYKTEDFLTSQMIIKGKGNGKGVPVF
jgi:hypothetical protein